jgi:hypothetical protein
MTEGKEETQPRAASTATKVTQHIQSTLVRATGRGPIPFPATRQDKLAADSSAFALVAASTPSM